MPRTWGLLCLASALCVAPGCDRSTVGPSTGLLSSTATLHAEFTDPGGDALSDPRVPVSPDLVGATVDVGGGNMTWTIQLRSGTLDRETTRVTIGLDTDENAATGIRQWDGFGADYAVEFTPSTGHATILKADAAGCAAQNSCFTAIGSVSLAGAETMQAVVPLSLLGGDDGRVNFWAGSFVWVSQDPSSTLDAMPDNPGAAPARVR